VQLRKNIFAKNSDFVLTHVYNITRGVWSVYNPQVKIDANDIVIGEADENNNVSIYDNTFALLQELNISKYGQIFLVNGKLYIFNRDKLSISKITYNGRQFVIQNLSASDVLSVFPGIEIINIDSYSNYNIFIEKDNLNANFIILSRYSQGYSEYKLSALKGAVKSLILPNMFAVSSNSDVVVAFHGKNVNPEETSESAPTYKFTIHTRGEASSNEDENSKYVQYDEETARDESLEESKHTPQIMPKIKTENETSTVNEELLSPAPSQNLEPPNEND